MSTNIKHRLSAEVFTKAEESRIKHQLSNSLMNTLTNLIIPLHLSRDLYKSNLFMQNKPNFKNAQIDISAYDTKGYDIFCGFCPRKNKPNFYPPEQKRRRTKPIYVKIGNFKSPDLCPYDSCSPVLRSSKSEGECDFFRQVFALFFAEITLEIGARGLICFVDQLKKLCNNAGFNIFCNEIEGII